MSARTRVNPSGRQTFGAHSRRATENVPPALRDYAWSVVRRLKSREKACAELRTSRETLDEVLDVNGRITKRALKSFEALRVECPECGTYDWPATGDGKSCRGCGPSNPFAAFEHDPM